MKQNILIIFSIISLFSCQEQTQKQNTPSADKNAIKEISFTTPDNVEVFGDLYEQDKSGITILLFHQGGSNAKAEYAPIIPKLLKKGYNILAIDQRLGGQIYGGCNRTVANISMNNYKYCDGYTDMRGALKYINKAGFTGDKILWGSSYSGSLAIQLGNEYQSEIKGVLAFSPASGKSLEGCRPDKYFETLKIPLIIFRPSREMERESVKTQFALAQKYNHQTYEAKNGVHGSSMLVEERVKNKVEDNWMVVMEFLEKLKKE